MNPFKVSSAPVQILAQDLRKLHMATQASRFVRVAAFYFIAHISLPSSWTWQGIAALAAASAEVAFQQLAPQLPVTPLVNTLLSSTRLRRYLADLIGPASTSGQPQTTPASSTASLIAPPAASPAAGTPMTPVTDPGADPAQKPQAVPKSSD